MDKYRITLENSKMIDYYELEKTLKRSGIDTIIQNKESDGTELGEVFDGLIILLPLLTPAVIQLRKAIDSYFKYKKSQTKKVSITIEKNGKKMKIDTENADVPDVNKFLQFFAEE